MCPRFGHRSNSTTETTQPKKAQLTASISTSTGKKQWKPDQTKSGGADKKPTESNPSSRSAGSLSIESTLLCWVCNEPHRAAKCLHKSKLSAFQALLAQEEQGGEDELRLLNALKKHRLK